MPSGCARRGGQAPGCPHTASCSRSRDGVGGTQPGPGSSGLGDAKEDPAATLPARPWPLARAAPRPSCLLPWKDGRRGAQGRPLCFQNGASTPRQRSPESCQMTRAPDAL